MDDDTFVVYLLELLIQGKEFHVEGKGCEVKGKVYHVPMSILVQPR